MTGAYWNTSDISRYQAGHDQVRPGQYRIGHWCNDRHQPTGGGKGYRY